MTEGSTTADFERWAEPHLTTVARYATRRVGPAERDRAVQETLIRAWQRWPAYDGARATPVGWLLGILAHDWPRDVSREPVVAVVELVDGAVPGGQGRDVDLERAVEGLGRRDRQVVDLHVFVSLDTAVVAQVAACAPETVALRLAHARDQLAELVGDDPDRMDDRLRDAARRWQEQQPPPPEVPLHRLDETLPRHLPWRRALAGAAVVLLVGGSVAVIQAVGRDGDTPPASADPSPPPHVARVVKTVPFRDLAPDHPALGRDRNGARVTPFDSVSASGVISGTVHPGETLGFDAVLQAPGLISLLPCPDYTITIGTLTTTRQLNCAQVPYYASLVRSTGRVTRFRPVLPAGTQVLFRMRVRVPDELGPQRVRWTLDGPREMPGFSGVVEVAPR